MNRTLSPVLSRILALFLAVVPIAAIYSLAVEPVLDARRGYAETIERSRKLIERFGRIGATREPLERQLAELRKRSKSTSGLLEGKSATLAAAQLQNRVKRIVTKPRQARSRACRPDDGADRATAEDIPRLRNSIRSLQTLPPQNERDLERVSIRIQMTARIEQLQKIFHAFETGPTYLFVDDVNLRQQTRRARRRRKEPVVDKRLLSVRLNLYGFAPREGS